MAIDIAKLDESIARQNDKMPFSGVVLVREKGKTVFAKGYGFANRAESIPNTINTRFGMASGAKTFTAVAICQLVERKLISFDTRLRDCRGISFPEFDPAITVHHLLTHSSGMPDYFDEEDTAEPVADKPKAKPATVVAPATRSTAPKRVRLKASQVAIAKKLGLTPEQYVRELLKLEA